MNRKTVFLFVLIFSLLPFVSAGAEEPLDVLFLTKSSGYEHGVVKRRDGQFGHAQNVMLKLADRHHFRVVPTKDAGIIDPGTLNQFDVVAFYTSGNLVKRGTDGNPPISERGRKALIEWVKNGGSFVGVHSGSDTFKNWTNDDGKKPYVRMLGGRFKTHGAQQKGTMTVKDHPTTRHLGDSWTLPKEEFYLFAEVSEDIQPLLVLETGSMSERYQQKGPYAISWYKSVGEGRVWYTGLGHRADVWTNEKFQEFLVRGINWAADSKAAE